MTAPTGHADGAEVVGGSRPALLMVRAHAEHESASTRKVVDRLQRAATSSGWRVLPSVRAVHINSRSAASRGRRRAVLAPQDARSTYMHAHDGPLVAVTTAGVLVRVDGRADPVSDRALISVERFLRYKAHVARCDDDCDVGQLLTDAREQLATLACEGVRDARALPLHVFTPDHDVDGLHEVAGAAAFDTAFGGPGQRRDGKGRAWKTGARHGTRTTILASTALPTGWHWDVQAGRNASTVHTGWELWELGKRRGHVNVTPDACIRGGSNCRQVWSFAKGN